MSPSTRPNSARRCLPFLSDSSGAFTITELLVVVAMLAVLVMVALPALAGVQNKAGRMQCANNLRQIGVGSMLYANEYRGWLPICTVGAVNGSGKVNNLGGLTYSHYVYFGGPANILVPTNSTPPASFYQNLGYLYRNGFAGRGNIFFCPDQRGTALGADAYSPLLSTDSSGATRSSYAFNPRIVDPTNGVIARAYQKVSDMPPHKLLAVDYFASVTPHYREGGWNVLFTDGTVQFSKNAQAINMLATFSDDESFTSHVNADQIMTCLEQDH